MNVQQSATQRIDVWSDYVCPFCYLELPALTRLQAERNGAVDVVWHAFELRPEPVPTLPPDGEYLHRVWDASVYPMARDRGLEMKLPPVQPRSRLAHEAAAFARAQHRFAEMHEAIFRAFFADGRDIGSLDVLADIGAAAGLDADALRATLHGGAFRPAVLDDEAAAQQFEIRGVPAMIVHGPNREPAVIDGAQPYDVLRRVIDGEGVGAPGR